MKSRLKIVLLAIAALAIGVGFARLSRTSHLFIFTSSSEDGPNPVSTTKSTGTSRVSQENDNILALIDDDPIYSKDLFFEVQLHTLIPQVGLQEDNPIAKPSSHNTSPAPLMPPEESTALHHRLLVGIMERRLLFSWIKMHRDSFTIDDPGRYTRCISDLQQILEDLRPHLKDISTAKDPLKSKLCQESIISQYLDEKIAPQISFSDQEISSYYASHLKDFKQPTRIIFRQILVSSEEEALKIKGLVTKANFSDLAKKHSTTPESADGGILGPFRRDQLPTFFELVFNMQPDEITSVLRSDYGFHIIMLVQKLPPQTLSLEKSKEQIIKILRQERRQLAYQTWLRDAMNEIKVTMIEPDQPMKDQ
jgi:hypothetical protein